MIKYTLQCHDCNYECESWFQSISSFEEQKDRGLLECVSCGSKNVDRGLMAPRVKTSSSPQDNDPRAILRNARKYVEKNFENVGDRFVDEAVAISRGEAEERAIHGKVDDEGRERLADEDVPYVEIPWVPTEDA